VRKSTTYDSLIIGAGPVGLTMARALQAADHKVCLCGELPYQTPEKPDLRTAALFTGSVRLLERLGAWPHISPHAASLSAIRIVDATGHLLRAPEQVFQASDVGLAELGFNVPNPVLIEALCETLATSGSSEPSQGDINLGIKVTRVTVEPDAVVATLADGTTRRGRIAVAADGRRSLAREAAAIGTKSWNHNQAALTAHFTHTLPNNAISTELHGSNGPCTVVPLDTHRSSLVWMDRPDITTARAELGDEDFISELEQRLQGLLGLVSDVTKPRIFPLSSMIANQFAANRVALIGEAGHAFPPIGAQGLNLGLRDVASLADHLTDAANKRLDIGAPDVLAGYSSDRRADIAVRTYGVDAFNQSLANRGAGLVRGAILHATKASPNAKRFLLERGLQPIGPWPSLMRE
jgi:2-octaprenyl-6-methoxyphenol hydroxylase